MPNTPGQSEPLVKRIEMAIMQFVILNKAKEGEVTRENLKQAFRGNLQMSSDHFDHCITQLVQEGHLKESGNKYTITDDGREDVQKLVPLALELPNVTSGQGGQTQRPGMQQQQQQPAGGRPGMGGPSGGGMAGQSGGMGSQSGGNVGNDPQGGNRQNR